MHKGTHRGRMSCQSSQPWKKWRTQNRRTGLKGTSGVPGGRMRGLCPTRCGTLFGDVLSSKSRTVSHSPTRRQLLPSSPPLFALRSDQFTRRRPRCRSFEEEEQTGTSRQSPLASRRSRCVFSSSANVFQASKLGCYSFTCTASFFPELAARTCFLLGPN